MRNRPFSWLVQIVTVLALHAIILQTVLCFPARAETFSLKAGAAASVPFEVPATESPTSLGVLLAANLTAMIAKFFAPEMLAPGIAIPHSSYADIVATKVAAVAGSLVPKSKALEPAPPPPPTPVTVTPSVTYDFDGDGKADTGRWHSSGTEFKVRKTGSSGYLTYSLGSSSAIAAPGDFNGDGKTDACVFSAGTWTYKTSTTATAQTISLGQAGDTPQAGDFDGDGTTDAAIYRVVSGQGTWVIKQSSNGSTVTHSWGGTGDIPITGDWDGDGKSDYTVYRPSDHTWYAQESTAGVQYYYWGSAIDIPIQGDFDGDGKSDVTVFRPSDGNWYTLTSASGFASSTYQHWGMWNDQPVPADYDGDGKTDLAVWRPTDGNWYILNSSGSPATSGWQLGVPGDEAVDSAYIKQVGGQVSPDAISQARLSPRNATGGTDLYSQNFGWGTSLVSLPGRAGLDASIGIGYNSLVWTKVGAAMVFDADHGNVTPGFKLGFATIEPAYYNSDTAKWSYMLVSPSGGRTDFRQVSASNVFESGDSSYSQITTSGATNPYDPVEDITLTLRSTDGTTMAYSWQYGAYRCTKITDRNGNYIAVTYDGAGRLATVTDTLGRVLTINDTDGTPTSITQTWRGTNGSGSTTTHTWATFSYTTKTVDTDWDSSIPGIVGPPDGTAVTVLDKITYADGSFTKFDYNGYIQVKKVSNIAADSTSHVLNYVEPNLASPSSGQTDCPRFTSTNNWAERFNVIGSTATAVTVTNTAPATSSFTGPNGSETTSVVKVGITGDPDNHYTRVHYGPSSYKEGLTLATEDCTDTGSSCGTRVRWTWNSLTQDNTGLAYILNPRVTESRVGDGTNTKRTTIGYGSNGYGLPELVKVYDTDLTTVLKTQKTTYDLSSNYTDRRIIGLPSESDLYEGTDTGGTLMSKVTYGFDESGYTGIGQSVSPGVGHDNTNFGTGLTFRANATSTLRWDVTTPTTSGNAVTSSVKYNTAGLPISATDPRGRVTSVSYTDNWNDSTSRTTYAYPTTITDPNSNSSTIKYRFDIGANVEANSPAPAGQSYGKTSKRVFDSVGRLERNSIYVNTTEKAYTRYEYPTNGVESQSYTPLVDVDGDGNIAEDEVLTDTWFDGAGRVIGARTEHPGSSGGWSAVLTDYDILGRVSRRSVPTEINTSWVAYGDDSARGFIYDYSYYDWKGRTVRTVPSDSTGSDGKDTLFSYAGCGCAGGQVTTVSGPVTTAVDVSGTTQTTKRRTQKSYEDILGRDFKTELWDLDGGSAPYSTTKATFNGRDQATLIREYDGPESSTTYQDTTMTYDGHGRVYQSHKPEQSGDYWSSGTHTTYSYNADDSIHTVTDARGVVTSYTYGHADDGSSSEYRKFLTKIAYTVPSDGSGIADPADVAYSYDTAGNRTSMTDGHGSMAYSYNSLSQMTDETRTFNDYLNYAPISDHGFEIQYTYTLTGALKSLTDPFGKEIDYTHDKAGRLSTVAGTTSVDGITTFANNPSYRAWGGLSHFEYGNGDYMNQSFNSKLAPTHFELRYSDTTTAMDKDLSYYNDGSPSYSQDHKNAHFDRLNKYDFAGRPVSAKTDEEARGNTQTTLSAMPYRQSYEYDAFSNITQRNNKQWGDDADPVSSASYNLTHTYSNNRVTNTGFSYDADGRQIASASPDPLSYTDYDAAGRAISQDNVTLSYDGDGAETVRYSANSVGADTDETATYFLRSSVLGGRTITEYSKTDYTDWSTSDTTTTFRYKSYVYAGGSEIAYKIHSLTYNSDKVLFEHSDPSGMSYKTTGPAGTINGAGKVRIEGSPAEMDGLNNNVGTLKPSSPETPTVPYHHIFNDSPMAVNPLQMCPTLDGMDAPCGQVHFLARVGGLQIELSDGHGHTGHADVEERLGHLFTRISVSQRGRWDGPDDFVPTPGSEPISTFGFIDLDWSGNGGGGRGGPNVGDDPVYTKQMQDCDSLLARLFGGKGAVAAGNDFEPEGMGGPGQKYRGPTEKAPTEGEFTNMMHLYGSSNGKEYTNVYVPPNPSATYANPRAYPGDVGGSYVFYYKSLTLPNGGRLTDVSLVVSHIKDYGFDSSSTNSSKYVLIGQVGGPGGDSGGMNPYRHVHMTLVAGRVKGSKALSSMKRIGFAKTFCN